MGIKGAISGGSMGDIMGIKGAISWGLKGIL